MFINNDIEFSTAQQKRIERDSFLNATDKYLLPDFPITEQQKQEILKYRQKLRAITEQSENPEEWVMPEKPSWLNI
ncbi:MAG TPA: tail fiber assembly protein [Bacteroidales bacterium]|nr:tail fiber assembly protein [Bacteroidales bacterium]